MSFPQANILMMSSKSEIPFFDFWSVDSPGFTFGMLLQGTSGESITIKWGDSSQNDYVFTGGDLIITHTYAVGTFQQSWKVDKSIVTTIIARDVNITGALPLALQDFSSLVNVRLDRNDITDNLSLNNWSTKLANWTDLENSYLYENNISGTIGDLQPAFNAWTKVTGMLWDNNLFSGSMDSVSFANTMISLRLYHNNLSGSVADIGQGSWTGLAGDRINDNDLTGLNTHVDILFINRASYILVSKSVALENNTEILTGVYQQPDLGTYSGDINDLSEAQLTNLAAGNDYDGLGINVIWSILERVWILVNLEKGAGEVDPRYGFSFTYDSAISIIKVPNGGALGLPREDDWVIIADAINGGGRNTTDWVDTNTDGLADNWQFSDIASIVTGNGFTGNAQHIQFSNPRLDLDFRSDLFPVVNGATYKLRFKYRHDTGSLTNWRVFQEDSTQVFIETSIASNTGNALVYESTSFVINDDKAYFYLDMINNPTVYFIELDEVELIQVSTNGVADKWNISGSLTPTIITGNGFLKNAQRIVYADTTAYVLSSNEFSLVSDTYLVSLKIRANVTVTLRVEDEATNIELLTTIPANTSNAIEHQTTSFAFTGTGAKIYVYIASPAASDWFEIDEIELLEV